MINPQEVYERLVTLGEDWAKTDYAASLLEETRKTELARLMVGLAGSHAAKESAALADALYRNHLAKMCEARRDANVAKVKYDSAKTYCDLMRTQEATHRVANRHAI